MENVVNLGMPHVGENIFQSIDTPGLINCLEVSQTWNELAGNVLIKRWKGKMFEACKSGESKIVQLLLERSNAEESGLNIKDRNGITPFMWACRKGHAEVVKLLLDHSNSIIELNERSNGLYERSRLLLTPLWPIYEKKSFGVTAFMFACENGHKDVVQLLLEYSGRVELNAENEEKWTAFMLACSNGHKDVVKLLLDYSEDTGLNIKGLRTIRYRDGLESLTHTLTPFMIACNNGHKDIVQLLLNHLDRMDLNAVDYIEGTAFMMACSNGHKDVVKLLLDQTDNIELNAKNIYGYDAFMRACEEGHKNVVKLLLDHSGNIELNARNTYPLTPATPGIVSHFTFLQDPYARNINGSTGFMLARSRGHKDVVQLLLKHSDPNARES